MKTRKEGGKVVEKSNMADTSYHCVLCTLTFAVGYWADHTRGYYTTLKSLLQKR